MSWQPLNKISAPFSTLQLCYYLCPLIWFALQASNLLVLNESSPERSRRLN
jgi:hypothetical protein